MQEINDIPHPIAANHSVAQTESTPTGFEATEVHESMVVAMDFKGKRVDQVAATLFPQFSRVRLKEWISEGNLTVNGNTCKPKLRLKGGETLAIDATIYEHSEDKPENIPLDIVYEDDHLLVVNKPAGLVVHPGAGNWTGTLVNGLLFHSAQLAALPRAGLVHRIDKDTTGLLVVAKTAEAQQDLSEQLKDKSVYRHYKALVVGKMIDGGIIDAPIKRHPMERTKMSVQDDGRDAVSHYDIAGDYAGYTLVDVQLETGRTHQIRVHMAHIGHPLVGDATYAGGRQLVQGLSEKKKQAVKTFSRQALHAYRLGFIHPFTHEDVLFESDIPDDMSQLLTVLAEADDMESHQL